MNASPTSSVANEQPAVQHFRAFIDGTWHNLALRFRGEGVGSRYTEALWQLDGTLKAIKAGSLHRLIQAGIIEHI